MATTGMCAIAAAALVALMGGPASAAETTLKVMAFNIWGGGANEGKPVNETVAAIRAAAPDIVAISETRLEGDPCTAEVCEPRGESVAASIAAALGFRHYYDQTAKNPAIWANAVLSRYPITGPVADDLGVGIDVDGRKVYVFCVNLKDAPYQPYQITGIEYDGSPFIKTEAEAISYAGKVRGASFDALIAAADAAADADAVFIAGDFNEPSHRDWTEATVRAGLQPLPVAFPGTSKLEKAGFIDAFRSVHPDPVAVPGMTWTPTTSPDDSQDHHDRIDFVFARGATLKVLEASVVGEKAPEADIVVTPWPSDHRAVIAKVAF